jgi:hypothetical protein
LLQDKNNLLLTAMMAPVVRACQLPKPLKRMKEINNVQIKKIRYCAAHLSLSDKYHHHSSLSP